MGLAKSWAHPFIAPVVTHNFEQPSIQQHVFDIRLANQTWFGPGRTLPIHSHVFPDAGIRFEQLGQTHGFWKLHLLWPLEHQAGQQKPFKIF